MTHFFSNIAANLKQNSNNTSETTANYQPPTHTYTDFLRDSDENSIYLKHSVPSEVHVIIKNKATLDSKIGVLKIANNNFNFTSTL